MQENLYTSGGEYRLPDGTEYIGDYHVHPTEGAMVGATHVRSPHPKLTPIGGGSSTGTTGITEAYDGTSWTELNNLSAARGFAGGKCGTTSASCMWVSGSNPSPPTLNKSTASEEWTKPDFQIKTVTQS